jgi:hypothetical protein
MFHLVPHFHLRSPFTFPSFYSPEHIFLVVTPSPFHKSTYALLHLFTLSTLHIFALSPLNLLMVVLFFPGSLKKHMRVSPLHISPFHLSTVSPFHLATFHLFMFCAFPPFHASTFPPFHFSSCSTFQL